MTFPGPRRREILKNYAMSPENIRMDKIIFPLQISLEM